MGEKKVSIVIPVFNEEKNLEPLYRQLKKVTTARNEAFEFIFVNDGSTDGSLDQLLQLQTEDSSIVVLDLSRNFGHHCALSAGMDEADGDAVILMDADMEDRPEDIALFLEKWHDGYQVIYAIRGARQVSLVKSLFYKLFHHINARLSSMSIEATGIFGLMDRVVVDQLKQLAERTRYIPGLRAWAGFRQVGVKVDRGVRYDKTPRSSLYQLYRLAFDSFTSSSEILLSLPLYVGFFLFTLSALGIIAIFVLKIFFDLGPWGWPSLVSIILALAGLQFIFIGLIGEFITRIFWEVKGRPLYIIRRKY